MKGEMSNGSNGKQAARRSFGRHREKVPRSNLNCTAIGDGLVTVVRVRDDKSSN